MHLYTFTAHQTLPFSLEKVFSFFENPENLGAVTPPHLHFQIMTPPPLKMGVGQVIDYTIRIRGIPIRWTTFIPDFSPPYHFVDVQLKGPYAFWYHRHTFKQVGGGVLMEDHVTYALPYGWIGRTLHTCLVKKDITSIFEYRSKVMIEKIKEILEP